MAESKIYPCILAREINGVIEYLYPRTDSKLVVYDEEMNVQEKIQEVEEYTRFTNNNPILEAIGGIVVGETFDHMPVIDVLKKLLYPHKLPVVSLSMNPNGGTYEMNRVVNITSASVSVTKKSYNIVSIILYDEKGNIVLSGSKKMDIAPNHAVNTSNKATTINLALNPNLTITCNNSSNTTLNYKVVVNDAENGQSQATKAFNFVYPYYYGSMKASDIINGSIDPKIISSLSGKKVEAKGNKTISFTNSDSRLVFATPATNGKITKIIDQNNLTVGVFDEYYVSGVTGTYHNAQNYYVYVTNLNTSNTNFSYTFSH